MCPVMEVSEDREVVPVTLKRQEEKEEEEQQEEEVQ